MTEPRPPYRVDVCDGAGCRPLLALDDAPVAEEEAVEFLAELARRLRAKGAIGEVRLCDPGSGRVVATRRVWPSSPPAAGGTGTPGSGPPP